MKHTRRPRHLSKSQGRLSTSSWSTPLVQNQIVHLQRSIGNRATANLITSQTNRPLIQRNVDAGIDPISGIITDVKVDRKNEEGIFGDEKGDHTTAHRVFRDMIHNQLIGERLADAHGILDRLFEQIKDLPGYEQKDYVLDEYYDKVDQLENRVTTALGVLQGTPNKTNLDAAAQALLNFRNGIPLSALRMGGVGGGEGTYADHLTGMEHILRENQKARRPKAFPIKDFKLADAIKSIGKLLDMGRLSQEIVADDSNDLTAEEVREQVFPGSEGDVEEDRDNVVTQHIESIRMAYPLLWNTYLEENKDIIEKELLVQIDLGKDEEYDPYKKKKKHKK